MVMMAMVLGGCAQVRVTDPPRTATEQFLLSRAAQLAVDQLTAEPLRGRRVYFDTRYFAAAEQAFVIGELRAKLLMLGVMLVESRADSEIVLEVRSGGVGIDRYDFLLGLPPILLSGGLGETGVPDVPIVTPELAIIKNIEQRGIASVAYIAYWADTGEVVATSGPVVGVSYREDYWFLGYGPRTVGNIPPTEEEP
jgi:hypothetical protein